MVGRNNRKPPRTRNHVDSYTVGSHVQRPAAHGNSATRMRKRLSGASHRSNARSGIGPGHAQVRISASTPRPSGSFEEVSQIHPATRSRESDRAYSRRRHKSTFAEEIQRRSHVKTVFIALGIVVLIVAIALGIGMYTYFKSTDQNLSFDASDAKEALVAPEADAPFYVLCTADLADPYLANNPPENQGYMLVRVDTQAKQLTFITIPAQLQVRMKDGEVHPLDEAHRTAGDAALISIVSDLAGIKVNHFITTSVDHIESMVEFLGGIHLDITEEIDDPRAGTRVVMVGDESLDGAESIVVLRATNFAGGFETTAKNRVAFTMQVLRQSLGTEGLDFASIVGEASKYISTDLTTSDLLSLGEVLKPVQDITVYQAILPYYETSDPLSGQASYSSKSEAWLQMAERFRAGEDPSQGDSDAQSVNKAGVTVEVRNGTITNGAAAKLAESLKGFGYQITDVGNADGGVIYPETLIVYTDPAYEGAAKAVIGDMGVGRAVNGGDYYSSDAQVIAIIGKDWMPS